jgi:hypothetical protein
VGAGHHTGQQKTHDGRDAQQMADKKNGHGQTENNRDIAQKRNFHVFTLSKSYSPFFTSLRTAETTAKKIDALGL